MDNNRYRNKITQEKGRKLRDGFGDKPEKERSESLNDDSHGHSSPAGDKPSSSSPGMNLK